jgi:hypothetical protein
MAAQLTTNLRFTEAVLRGESKGGRYPNSQWPKIERALSTRYPGRFVGGHKCRAFYQALMGNPEALVLDRWAIRATGYQHPTKRHDLNMTVRRELDAAYREAAKLCGETVRAFQATVWIAIRESTPNKRGIIPRLADIT